jgi:hypothetical protein
MCVDPCMHVQAAYLDYFNSLCRTLVVDLYGPKLPADVHGIHHSVRSMLQHVCVLKSESKTNSVEPSQS